MVVILHRKKKSGSASQSLIPVTIKQLLDATQAHQDDVFKIDGRELNQVTFIGCILRLSNLTTNVSTTIDDGTGTIEVRIWLDQEDQSDAAIQKRTMWREGTYVRVVGNLRSFGNKRSVVAFRIQPITDFNELTYHLLESIYVHLFNIRGGVQQQQQQQQQQSNYGYATPYQPMQVISTVNQSLHNDILQIIANSPRTQEGVSLEFICNGLERPKEEVRTALEFLASEGHVYSTLDEDHFNVH